MSEIVVSNHGRSIGEVVQMTLHVQQVMQEVMVKDTHYGKIPGCGDKPALLKPGAEKLCVLFRLAAVPNVEIVDLGDGHREYRVRTEIRQIGTDHLWGVGVGSCSTKESKYRWRADDKFEVVDGPIPRDAKDRKAEYRKQGFGMRKVDGDWKWVKFSGDGGRVENPDIADTFNTVLKMAKKRSLVDAVLTATAASDLFTQDIEELVEADARLTPARPEPVDAEIVEGSYADTKPVSKAAPADPEPKPDEWAMQELAGLLLELDGKNRTSKEAREIVMKKALVWKCSTIDATLRCRDEIQKKIAERKEPANA